MFCNLLSDRLCVVTLFSVLSIFIQAIILNISLKHWDAGLLIFKK